MSLAELGRRVYEIHRASDVQRGRRRTPIPTWDQLPEAERSRLIAAYWRALAQYGRTEAREARIT